MRPRSMRVRMAGAAIALATIAAACSSRPSEPQPTPDAASHDFGLNVAVVGDAAVVDEAVKTVGERIDDALDAAGLPDVEVQLAGPENEALWDSADVVVSTLACDAGRPEVAAVWIEVVCADAVTDDAVATWRLAPDAELLGRAMAQVMGRALGTDATLAIARADPGLASLVEAFEAVWTQGGTVSASIEWEPGTDEPAGVAEALTADEPEGWLIAGGPDGWELLGPQLASIETWDPLRTFATPELERADLPETAGTDATAGLRGLGSAPVDERVVDAVSLAFLAAIAAGSGDAQAIADSLPGVAGPEGEATGADRLEEAVRTLLAGDPVNFEGAAGALDLDADGTPAVVTLRIWRFAGDQLETVETFRAERPAPEAG